MTQEKPDLRVRRTQKMLQDAFIDLIAERGFEEVSVGLIADRAMVNRATFYRHYQDKYDLAEKIFEGVIRQMQNSIGMPRAPRGQLDPANPPAHWVNLFEHIGQNAKLYSAMLGPRGNPWFVSRMRTRLIEMIREREELRTQVVFGGQPRDFGGMPLEVTIAFFANFLISAISWWLESGGSYSARQMAGWFAGFIMRGYLSYFSPPSPPIE